MKSPTWHILAAVIIFVLLCGTAAWHLAALIKTMSSNNIRLTEQKRSIERELEELYKQKRALEKEFVEAKKENESLISRINDYEVRIEEIRSESAAKMRDYAVELDIIKALLAQKDKEIAAKDAEIRSLKEAPKENEEKIRQLTKRLIGRKSVSLVNNDAVSLQPITITAKPEKINGRVLEINHDYGFLVANIGAVAGVKKGDTLFVLRHKEMLGKVVVERTSDEVCVAKIMYKSLADEVQKGDSVRN